MHLDILTVNIRFTHVRLQRPKHFPAKAGIKEDIESTPPPVIAPSELAPVNGKGATPFAQQTVVLTKQAYIELTWQANYWRAQYEQLLEREAALKAAVAAQQATSRELTYVEEKGSHCSLHGHRRNHTVMPDRLSSASVNVLTKAS